MKDIYKKSIIVLLVIFSLFTAAGCDKTMEKITEEDYAMGTYINITVYHDNPQEAREAINQAFSRVKNIENLMSINVDNSEVIRLNNAAGKNGVKLSPDTIRVLKKGLYYSKITQGKFDITIGPLVKLWNIGFENARVPDKKEIQTKLNLVDYKKVKVNSEEGRVMLGAEGMIIDLGGIAKGYAADAARKILKDRGIKHAIINLGGNILTLGKKPDGSLWKVGIQDPRLEIPRGNYMGIVKVKDKAVVTSGNYERYIKSRGEIYHHILNPDTGMPAKTGVISATVIADYAVDADALSTSIFVLGPEKGMELAESLDGIEAIIITENFKVITTKNLKEFEITNEKFEMK